MQISFINTILIVALSSCAHTLSTLTSAKMSKFNVSDVRIRTDLSWSHASSTVQKLKLNHAQIETTRLILRPVRLEDEGIFYELFSNAEHVKWYQDGQP